MPFLTKPKVFSRYYFSSVEKRNSQKNAFISKMGEGLKRIHEDVVSDKLLTLVCVLVYFLL